MLEIHGMRNIFLNNVLKNTMVSLGIPALLLHFSPLLNLGPLRKMSLGSILILETPLNLFFSALPLVIY